MSNGVSGSAVVANAKANLYMAGSYVTLHISNHCRTAKSVQVE
jgi:hypothetical protein